MSNPEAEELRSRKKVKKKNQESGIIIGNDEPFLPDDIIMDILSRLPTKDALRFQCVCKRGKNLISSRDFINSHNKHSVPMILVMNSPASRQTFLLDKCWESERKNSKIQKSCRLYPDHIMQLSHDGLIVSKKHENPGIFIIFNPIYSDIVKITVPTEPQSEIYGVFYQPSIKEYCTLWAFNVPVKPLKVQYKMLNLGSQPNWRDITNPWTQNGRIRDILPVLVNEYLYWVVEPDEDNVDSTCILEFDTRSEVFEVIPYPGLAVNFIQCKNINLLQANGRLLLVQVYSMQYDLGIDIWTLEDRANKIWTSIRRKVIRATYMVRCKAVAFWNGELVVQSAFGLFVCNLKLATRRKFGRSYGGGPKSFAAHVMSIASLENCTSDICMVEEGNKNPVKTERKQTDHLVR